MKYLFGFLLAAGIAAQMNGRAFADESPAHIKIIWAVPTNVWPVNKIWSYKVIPQEFSDAVISNALALGSFTTNDKLKLPPEALAIDQKAMRFANKDSSRELVIAPTLGYMEYSDENADAKMVSAVKGIPEAVVGVPDLQEAERLGLKYARLLGIEVNDFATKPGSRELEVHWIVTTRGWTDPKTKNETDEIDDFGISFTRCIDGFPVSSFGDFEVFFGNNAKVSKLIVSWRNLRPYELHDNLISPEQLVKSIENGHIPLPRLPDPLMSGIKTVTITNATPRYNRKAPDEPMDFVVPALQLDAVIDCGTTNQNVWFQTGIFSPKSQGGLH